MPCIPRAVVHCHSAGTRANQLEKDSRLVGTWGTDDGIYPAGLLPAALLDEVWAKWVAEERPLRATWKSDPALAGRD